MQAWHPDKFPNPTHKAQAEEKTKEINEAYTILRNPEKRKAYDAQRQAEQTEAQRRQRERTEDERQREETEAKRRGAEEEQRQREKRRTQEEAEATARRAKEEKQRREQAEAQRRQREEAQRQQKAGRAGQQEQSKHRGKLSPWQKVILVAFVLVAFAILYAFLDQRQQPSQYSETQPSSSPLASSTTSQMTARDFFIRGRAKSDKQDFRGALADYTQALTLGPQLEGFDVDAYSEVYRYRGLVRADLRDYEGALADYTQAITLDPKFALTYRDRAQVRYVLHDYQGALADYQKSADLYKSDFLRSDPSAWQGLPSLYQPYQDILEQIKQLRKRSQEQ